MPTKKTAAISLTAAMCATLVFAQDGAPSGPGRRGPAQYWWVNKTEGGVYKPPMRPLWKLSDLKQMHASQNNWLEQIILDPEQDATYNAAAPGTKFDARMHPDTPGSSWWSRVRCISQWKASRPPRPVVDPS